ncbi:LA2681 family HEPN domain-containing protein [Rhodococcus pyridinivorans]|uniref:LA2681 family HEPN domain-containing protein n=1 Tax=Rhodococcus pyridinivorans TaxID=103816 RepID=UPI0022849B41|nr:LA2681 family HEPN domain-containing protein [Rhodococcus pyridinivorans]WAL49662.1 LA2681 family HEPN domain-containing protein [Rhodococcus pyridinivorans]
MNDAEFMELQSFIIELNDTAGLSQFADAMSTLQQIHAMVSASAVDAEKRCWLLLLLSSTMNNLAAAAGSIEGLDLGVAWARSLIDDEETPEHVAAEAMYNVGTGQASIYHIRELADIGEDIAELNPSFRLKNIDELRTVRRILRVAGHEEYASAEQRSRALCNLGNTLDDSGRWVEAYTAYSDSLKLDPSNGNAAGNAAELLRRRLEHGRDELGHIAAAYDRYLQIAKTLSARTAEIAGAQVAQRWDSLEPVGGQGHFRHVGDELDPYHQWIVEHRLALTATVEGLGGGGDRWDSAGLEGVVPSTPGKSVPPIFAAMNVLKAEYLVARRMAYRGQLRVNEAGASQHPDDSGLYTDTLDGGIYGEGPALLLLAQRSALDVLDKIAVAANEHFEVGLDPGKVSFSGFWKDRKSHAVRPSLSDGDPGYLHVLALAELAADLLDDGMYPYARLLRNAGTHRIVHATFGYPTGPTRETFSTVDLDELIQASVEALWVCRAAFLYFVDLLESQLPDVDSADQVRTLPNQK